MPAPLKHTVSAYCNIITPCNTHFVCCNAIVCASLGIPACTVQCIRRNDPTRHNGKMFVHSAELYSYVYKDGGDFCATYCIRVHMTLPKLVGNARHDLLLLVYHKEVL